MALAMRSGPGASPRAGFLQMAAISPPVPEGAGITVTRGGKRRSRSIPYGNVASTGARHAGCVEEVRQGRHTPLGRIDIQRSQSMAAARWMKARKWSVRRS